MKIQGVGNSLQRGLPPIHVTGIEKNVFPSFHELMRQAEASLGSVKPPFRDLLRTQVNVNSYALYVELVTKIVDSASASIRRFQQG